MKITANRLAMLEAFSSVAKVASTNKVMAAIGNVKLVAKGGVVELMATDTEIGVRCKVDNASSDSDGAVLLPPSRFLPILKDSSDDTVTLDVKPNGTLIKCSGSFKLQSANPDEFPDVVEPSAGSVRKVDAKLLKVALNRTSFCCDPNNGKFALGGVCMEFSKDKLAAVGLDTRRMAWITVDLEGDGDIVCIVPQKSAMLLARLLPDVGLWVEIHATESGIAFKCQNLTFVSRLIAGRFPKWRQLLDKPATTKIPVNVGQVKKLFERSAITAGEESHGIDVSIEGGLIKLTGGKAEVGESSVELVVAYDGEPIKLVVDHRYVSQGLGSLDLDSTLDMEIGGPAEPIFFRPDSNSGYLVMVMGESSK